MGPSGTAYYEPLYYPTPPPEDDHARALRLHREQMAALRLRQRADSFAARLRVPRSREVVLPPLVCRARSLLAARD